MSHGPSCDKCPCGSGALFRDCCKAVLADQGLAQTAEQLMRSRYTAYTLGNNDYLLKSWAPETRPDSIHPEEEHLHWIGLEVEECDKGLAGDKEGMVVFTARFISSDYLCSLHERSSFIRKDGRWYYLSGKATSGNEKLARNAPCPCGSGKKYKRCCSRY